MTTPITVKLSELKVDTLNVRKTDRGAEPEFAASIRKMGVIERLIVRRSPNAGFLVVNGSKRFDALEFLKKKKEKANGVPVTDDFPVNVEVIDLDDAAARTTSLTTNLIRSDMHPVDEFEAFAQMIQAGETVEGIAAMYGRKVPEIRQALSIASIHPEIRAAWREDKIDGEAAEAYARTKDLEHQLRIFKKLKGRAGETYLIDEEIGGRSHDVGKLLKFVGVKAYEAAGHHVNLSLFEDRDNAETVDNVPALVALANKKLSDEIESLKKDGWAWAILKDDGPNDLYAWRKLPPGTPTKEQKALAGCTVDIHWRGNLEVVKGIIKPGVTVKIPKTPAQKKKASEASKKAKTESGGLSNALAQRLSRTITFAAADALKNDAGLALDVVIASLAAPESPAVLEPKGMEELEGDSRYDNEFDQYLKLVQKKSQSEKLALLATWLAGTLDLQCYRADQLPLTSEGKEADAAFLNALKPKDVTAALRKRFDAKDYFGSVSRALCVAAVRDAMGDDHASKVSKMKAAEAAKFAIANVPKTGWLPVELRVDGYDGPKAKPSKKR